MNDLYDNEMKDLHEKAYDWTGQTVLERFESAIRLLKVHGILSSGDTIKAWGNLKKLQNKTRNTNND